MAHVPHFKRNRLIVIGIFAIIPVLIALSVAKNYWALHAFKQEYKGLPVPPGCTAGSIVYTSNGLDSSSGLHMNYSCNTTVGKIIDALQPALSQRGYHPHIDNTSPNDRAMNNLFFFDFQNDRFTATYIFTIDTNYNKVLYKDVPVKKLNLNIETSSHNQAAYPD
jgi:hypothetical protein